MTMTRPFPVIAEIRCTAGPTGCAARAPRSLRWTQGRTRALKREFLCVLPRAPASITYGITFVENLCNLGLGYRPKQLWVLSSQAPQAVPPLLGAGFGRLKNLRTRRFRGSTQFTT